MDKYEGMYRVETRLTDNSERYGCGNTEKEIEPLENMGREAMRCEKKRIEAARYGQRYADAVPYKKSNGRMASYESDEGQTAEYSESLNKIGESYFCYDDEIIVYETVKQREKKGFRGMFIRLFISAAIFLAVFGMSKTEIPFFQKATVIIKQAVTYDLDNKKDKDLGEVKAVTLIKDMREKTDEEQE